DNVCSGNAESVEFEGSNVELRGYGNIVRNNRISDSAGYTIKIQSDGKKYDRGGNVVENNVASKRDKYSHDLFADEALQFVEKNKARPFFLYLSLTIPHANNEAGKKGMEVPSDEPYSNEPWPQPQRNHAAMITRMDRDIGRLLEKLQELGLDEHTIIFFTSDNGPHQAGGG
ncbi:MAG: sulfatase-like hydrolase/transferase, partial [Bryobacterales bacterium]|nr:sulfatase-like hydrolase/transferase [Bryobacterales bacterium]